MTEVPGGPCFQISPSTLFQGTYSQKRGRGNFSSLSHLHLWTFQLLSYLQPSVSAPEFTHVKYWHQSTGIWGLPQCSCFLPLSVGLGWQSDETSTTNAGRKQKKKKKEGIIRWINLFRNLPMFEDILGYRRCVFLVMRIRCDVSWPRALGGFRCQTQGFLDIRLTRLEALRFFHGRNSQRTQTVFI